MPRRELFLSALWKIGLEAIGWLRAATVPEGVWDDDVVLRGIDCLAGPEQLASEG
jgi:hypothetical protein